MPYMAEKVIYISHPLLFPEWERNLHENVRERHGQRDSHLWRINNSWRHSWPVESRTVTRYCYITDQCCRLYHEQAVYGNMSCDTFPSSLPPLLFSPPAQATWPAAANHLVDSYIFRTFYQIEWVECPVYFFIEKMKQKWSVNDWNGKIRWLLARCVWTIHDPVTVPSLPSSFQYNLVIYGHYQCSVQFGIVTLLVSFTIHRNNFRHCQHMTQTLQRKVLRTS